MEDITNNIKARQLNNPLLTDILQSNSSTNNKKLFSFDTPTIISANDNTIDGYKDLIFIMSGDRKLKGIIWQKLNTNQTYTYLINEEKNLIQSIINGKITKDGEPPTPEEATIITQEITFFQQQYNKNVDAFSIFGNITHLKKS